MEKFFSCDWGTSSFRLKLVEVKGLRLLAEEKSSLGILQTFELWKASGKPDESRVSFYCGILENSIQRLEQKISGSLKGLPVIISGMASSSIGICNLPYAEFPFSLDGSDLYLEKINASNHFPNDLIMISGVRTQNDLMRGEESILVGCDHSDKSKEIFIFPGTHSKHVYTREGKAVDCKTFMTGEFFELLSQKSILSVSVERNNDLTEVKHLESFTDGIKSSIQSNLLNSTFLVRVNGLLGQKSAKENYHFLSGLLIGSELMGLSCDDIAAMTLVGERSLLPYYEKAFDTLAQFRRLPTLKVQRADEAIIKGQLKVYESHLSRRSV